MSDWILLRGLTREARHWGELPAALRRSGALCDDDRLTMLDLPGNGNHAGRRSPATVAQIMSHLRTDAALAGLHPPYRLLAMSLGGMVATAWAQQHADEVERLVLINTSMRPFGALHQRLRPGAWPAVLGLMRSWHDGSRCEAIIHRLTCANTDAREADLARWAAIRADAPVTRANALRQLLAAARFRAGTVPPRCATLLLSSAADRLVSPACSARLAAAWSVPHRVHPWAGHDLPHDDPQWLARQVAGWMALPTVRSA